MITATILFFVAGPVENVGRASKIWTTGPTGPVEKSLALIPVHLNPLHKHIVHVHSNPTVYTHKFLKAYILTTHICLY